MGRRRKRLRFDDVEAGACDVAPFERGDERCSVDELAAADVDEPAAGSEELELSSADDPAGLRRERHGEDDEVAVNEHPVELLGAVGHVGAGCWFAGLPEREDADAEPSEPGDHLPPDAARADDADGFAQKSITGSRPPPLRPGRLRESPRCGEQECDRVLGHPRGVDALSCGPDAGLVDQPRFEPVIDAGRVELNPFDALVEDVGDGFGFLVVGRPDDGVRPVRGDEHPARSLDRRHELGRLVGPERDAGLSRQLRALLGRARKGQVHDQADPGRRDDRRAAGWAPRGGGRTEYEYSIHVNSGSAAATWTETSPRLFPLRPECRSGQRPAPIASPSRCRCAR